EQGQVQSVDRYRVQAVVRQLLLAVPTSTADPTGAAVPGAASSQTITATGGSVVTANNNGNQTVGAPRPRRR
ncbi:hypothetical protein, partial [Nocardia aurea]|uniref:hypothetical protein n=1 Tax=Nocardia aurea TaxID=2144174 RepID=UPI0033AD9CFC